MHCDVGEWSEWSPCSRSGRTCGFKRGQETRTRQVLQYPSSFGNPCPEISEVKECLVKRRKCIGKDKGSDTVAERHCFYVLAGGQILTPDPCDPAFELKMSKKNKKQTFWNIQNSRYSRHCPLLVSRHTLNANSELVTQGTISPLYEFQTPPLQLVQSELVLLPLRTATVYSEDCHCG